MKLLSISLLSFIILFILLVILYSFHQLYEKDEIIYDRNIYDDGYKIFDTDNKYEILKSLPNNYIYIDYIYEIKGCTLATFHRDITSSQYIYNTKYPVYTHISYYNSGPLLTICPESHKTTSLVITHPVIIYGEKKTSILFNCDIIHTGAINNFGMNRHAIQYKICHKDDLYKLKHLIGINKSSHGICNDSRNNYVYALRKLSLLFSFIINHLFTSLLFKKPKKDSISEYLIDNFFIGDFYNS